MTTERRPCKRGRIFILLMIFSALAGAGGSFVPWGKEDGFHGQGVPIPSVYWDRASLYYADVTEENDYFIDFPNPLAFVLNPLVIFLFCTFAWGLVELVLFLVRRFVRRRRSVTP